MAIQTKIKIAEWVTIITLFVTLSFGYGKLSNQVESDKDKIIKMESKIDKIADDVSIIKGYLIK